MTVFIVDDDEAVLDSLKILLELEGFDVEGFSSGEEFVRSYRAGANNVLLLDLHMPGMSGEEVLRRLSTMRAAVDVIVVTAGDDPVARDNALRAGARTVMYKPVDHSALLAEIAACGVGRTAH